MQVLRGARSAMQLGQALRGLAPAAMPRVLLVHDPLEPRVPGDSGIREIKPGEIPVGVEVVRSGLQGMGWQVHALSMGTSTCVGGNPDEDDVARGLDLLRALRCEVVVGVGSASAMNVGKTVAMLAAVMDNHTSVPLDRYLSRVPFPGDLAAGSKPPQPPAAVPAQGRLPFAAVPLAPCGGDESSETLRVRLDETRLVASEPALAPQALCIDPWLMAFNAKPWGFAEKCPLVHLRAQGVALALGGERKVAVSSLRHTAKAAECHASGDEEAAFEAAADASLEIGAVLHRLSPTPRAPHTALAYALFAEYPYNFEFCSAALLSPGLELLSDEQVAEVDACLAEAGLDRDALRFPHGLDAQRLVLGVQAEETRESLRQHQRITEAAAWWIAGHGGTAPHDLSSEETSALAARHLAVEQVLVNAV